jgi:ketosteroid isomerase-like protein
VNSLRTIAVSLAAAATLSASVSVQAQSASTPHTPPAELGTSSIATQQQQDEVKTLMAAYLGLWLAEDPSRYALGFVADDAVFEYPYADDGYRRIEGHAAIRHALRKLPVTASNWVFSDLRLFQTLYPDVFFVEYRAKAYVPATQHRYESRYLARITVRDGKIADYVELWERDAKAAAFGTPGQTDRVSSAASATPIP